MFDLNELITSYKLKKYQFNNLRLNKNKHL